LQIVAIRGPDLGVFRIEQRAEMRIETRGSVAQLSQLLARRIGKWKRLWNRVGEG
jgi:muconolactone delta-isomerase